MAPRKISLELPNANKLRGLQLRPSQGVHGARGGEHRSHGRGFSSEFAEHREYVLGDDLRHLDWKVFGRTDKYYLKQFEDETNLQVQLVLDTSSSMLFQHADQRLSKYEFAARFALSLAWVVLHEQDGVGLTLLEDRSTANTPARSGMGQLLFLKGALEDAVPGEHQSMTAQPLHDLASRIGRRGVVCLFSDFLDPSEKILQALAHLRSCHQEILAFQVLDPAELEFPFEGAVQFDGLEELGSLVLDSDSLREHYLLAFKQQQEMLRTGLKKLRIEYIQLLSNEPPEEAAGRFLSHRMARGV